jgi:hypothetical protein
MLNATNSKRQLAFALEFKGGGAGSTKKLIFLILCQGNKIKYFIF